ncbi:hypothetical protein ACFQV2_14275 [Actinokineospora soli]|uniref:PPE family protein n=1 Tax=Actinokineospora soli TaxID=1048753 RepID=A0ABW2TM84_9PSEU
MTFTVPTGGGFPTNPVPEDGVNWDAYTHEELHRMLWDQADVNEVAAIADEWRRHSAELADQAARLRDQQTALQEHWQGESAELAATRLGELAERVDGISARAAANERAAREAGEALALARATLPPPPGAPGTPPAPPSPFAVPSTPGLPTAPTGPQPAFALPSAPESLGLPASQPAPFTLPSAPESLGLATSQPAPFALPSAPEPFGLPASQPESLGLPTSQPAPFTLPSAPEPFALPAAQPAPFTLPSAPEPMSLPTAPSAATPSGGSGFFFVFGAPPTAPTGTGMAPAFGSVGSSGSSMFFNDLAASQAKAQAVQAMRTYEASLRGGEALVSVPGDVGSRSYGVAGGGSTATPRGGGLTADPRSGGGVPWQKLVGPGAGQPKEQALVGKAPVSARVAAAPRRSAARSARRSRRRGRRGRDVSAGRSARRRRRGRGAREPDAGARPRAVRGGRPDLRPGHRGLCTRG